MFNTPMGSEREKVSSSFQTGFRQLFITFVFAVWCKEWSINHLVDEYNSIHQSNKAYFSIRISQVSCADNRNFKNPNNNLKGKKV